MDIKTTVEVIVTDMEAGKITGFILDGIQYNYLWCRRFENRTSQPHY